jgi:hypothetical protein
VWILSGDSTISRYIECNNHIKVLTEAAAVLHGRIIKDVRVIRAALPADETTIEEGDLYYKNYDNLKRTR